MVAALSTLTAASGWTAPAASGVFTLVSNTSYAKTQTTTGYSFTGSSLLGQFTPAGGGSASLLAVALRPVASSNANEFGFEIQNGKIFLYVVSNGVWKLGVETTYSPTAHAWVRLRESNGVGFLDVAPDGLTWTNLSSLSYGALNVTDVTTVLYAYQATGASVATIASLNTPPTPPPPAGQSVTEYSDLTLVFLDHTSIAPAEHLPEFQTVSTPVGPGFAFSISDTTDVTPWDSGMKCVLAKMVNDKDPVVMNTTQTWNFYVYLPTQEIVTSWNGGVLWEFHTPGNSSGNNICLDNTGRGPTNPSFRFVHEGSGTFTWVPLTFNTYHHFTITVRWSTGSDGFYQASMDGVEYQNFTGATVFASDASGSDDTPFLQFGFYADIGASNGVASVGTNQVTISGITVA